MTSFGRRALGKGQLLWARTGFGSHGDDHVEPDAVVSQLVGKVSVVEESLGHAGLRTPQVGALHALLARRTLGDDEPTTIVLPTGTGKTETMLASFCLDPLRTLVIVPSDALRTQIAEKFATLGVLPALGVVAEGAIAPVVAVLKKRLATSDEVDELAAACNVLVTTAAALHGLSPEVLDRLVERFEQLFIDEAHHVAAKTWTTIAEAFAGRRVVQFTATPFREDGRQLPGQIAYAFPLRLAQAQGYFAPINYKAITSLAGPDSALAEAAVAQLRADLDDGKDHILMARVSTVRRASEVLEIYEDLAPEFGPRRIDSKMTQTRQSEGRAALNDRTTRIVVCVDMLGEGFDLPALKIAAIHDPHRSLAVTLQFIGRFARVGGEDDHLGEATAFVPRQIGVFDDRLRQLYAEDSDWNALVSDLSEAAVQSEAARSQFDRDFTQTPDEIALATLRPKMSAVMYQADDLAWNPDAIYDLFDPDELYTRQIAVNHTDHVLWFVTAERSPVPWGDVKGLAEVVHHFHLVHCDLEMGRLYINSSNNDSLHESLAKAVGGDGVTLFKGPEIYRILGRIQRRVPTNIGLLDSVNRNRRFMMLVGADVVEGFGATAGQKMKTNIFAHGYASGARVSFGASLKGRVWSRLVAHNLLDWVRWATEVGDALTDTSISLDDVMSGFIIPDFATSRPSLVALGVEWPYDIVGTLSEDRAIVTTSGEAPLIDVTLEVTDWSDTGSIQFDIVADDWTLSYAIGFGADGPYYTAAGEDALLRTSKGDTALSEYMTKSGMTVFFTRDTLLAPDGHLLQPAWDLPRFPADQLQPIDWSGIDIHKESQGPTRDNDSIQYRTIEFILAGSDWDVIVDDDGTGEVADIVCLKRTDQLLAIMLVHCKYAHGNAPGARLDDLYEVCGQAVKSHNARADAPRLVANLVRRETNRLAKHGHSGLVHGTEAELLELASAAHLLDVAVTVAIVQPGLSQGHMSDAQAEVLASVQMYLSETYNSSFRVLCSL